MRGVGRSSAAISIVNALPTGIGCAHGVRLYAAATVELQAKATMQIEVEPDASRTPIVVRSLEATLRRLRPEAGFFARLHLDSEIPVAKGLKSSSAVATATIRAVADALETDLGSIEIARMAAEVGRDRNLNGSHESLPGADPGPGDGLVPDAPVSPAASEGTRTIT